VILHQRTLLILKQLIRLIPKLLTLMKIIIVRPFPNGFTYPLDARVAPTNAYLEFWHPETGT